jgi:hypothetical protein
MFCFPLIIKNSSNCSEPTFKMLRILHLFLKFRLALNSYKFYILEEAAVGSFFMVLIVY